MKKQIKVQKRWFIKTHYCQQCMKPIHKAWVRTTPKTEKAYCEGCAVEKGIYF